MRMNFDTVQRQIENRLSAVVSPVLLISIFVVLAVVPLIFWAHPSPLPTGSEDALVTLRPLKVSGLLWLTPGGYDFMPNVVVFIAGMFTLSVCGISFEANPSKKYIPKGLITFEPDRPEFHRYNRAEMCGPLPTTLYKVLPQQYACRLLDDGEMVWSTLTYFQHALDLTRGDPFDGNLRYFPAEGLTFTRTEREGRPNHAELALAAHGSQFMAKQSHHIFVYSTTLNSQLAIGDAADRVCVEIFEPATFLEYIRRAVERHCKAHIQTLIHDRVRYWSPEKPPSEVWALPHRLTMSKHQGYAQDQEYRFAFGTRRDVFDFENVTGLIVPEGYEFPRLELEPQEHRMKLMLGSLADCCRLVEPWAESSNTDAVQV